MEDNKKPTPKTQKQLAQNQKGDSYTTQGTPIIPTNPNREETGINFNRSEKISYKGDNTKPFSIGIQDLDEAVFYYFNNVIKPFVYQGNQRREVPVIYASPERWKSYRSDGYYRDKSGAIMAPLIAIKRDKLSKDRTVTNKLDANSPNLYTSFQKNFNKRNMYSNFNVLNNRTPSKEFYPVVVPDYVTLEYSGVIQTYFMEQINKIIEAIEYASDSYWGNPQRFKFRAFIDSFSTAQQLTEGEDRLVKSEFNIRLRGYIIPDVIQKDLNSIKKAYSKSKVRIKTEVTSDINSNLTSTPNQERTTIDESTPNSIPPSPPIYYSEGEWDKIEW